MNDNDGAPSIQEFMFADKSEPKVDSRPDIIHDLNNKLYNCVTNCNKLIDIGNLSLAEIQTILKMSPLICHTYYVTYCYCFCREKEKPQNTSKLCHLLHNQISNKREQILLNKINLTLKDYYEIYLKLNIELFRQIDKGDSINNSFINKFSNSCSIISASFKDQFLEIRKYRELISKCISHPKFMLEKSCKCFKSKTLFT